MALATTLGRSSGWDRASSWTNHAPCAYRCRTASVTRRARRLLPTPPGPVSVTRRDDLSCRATSAISLRRPMKELISAGTLPRCCPRGSSSTATARAGLVVAEGEENLAPCRCPLPAAVATLASAVYLAHGRLAPRSMAPAAEIVGASGDAQGPHQNQTPSRASTNVRVLVAREEFHGGRKVSVSRAERDQRWCPFLGFLLTHSAVRVDAVWFSFARYRN